MSKSNIFVGQPVFGQIIGLVPRCIVKEITAKRQSDRYYKAFKTYDHVLTMLYAAMSGVETLRAVELGMMGAATRLVHLGMAQIPRKSTISDGNKLRASEVFADIYQALNLYYRPLLSDSRLSDDILARLTLIDSTTISLFKEILKAAGRSPASGRRKGGIKAHVAMDTATGLPKVVCFSSSASSDTPYMKKAGLSRGDIAVFDMGYIDYGQFRAWGAEGIHFVTRQKENALYTVLMDFTLSEFCDPCIASDQIVEVVDPASKESFKLRRIVRKADSDSQELVFWTNILNLNPDMIAAIYKHRWKIELLFKCLKQNFPLKYFLGDNRNAIEIQIWSCLIAHLLYKVILHQNKKKWAFSNFCDLIRQHLFTYIDMAEFVKNPEQALRKKTRGKARSPGNRQYELF
jgi:hypothetical protein